jgi:hypothetical protein
METAPTNLATKNPVELLTPAERGAYERFLRSGSAPLGPALAGRLFESFLNGRTVWEIHRDNSELNLGAIIAARVEYAWDALRAEHMQKLMSQAQDRALRAQLEAVDFLFDVFQVTHLVNKEKYEKFRKTRNIEDLKGAIQVENMKQYGDLVGALLKVLEKAPGLPSSAASEEEPSIPATKAQPALPTGSFLERAAAQRREEQAEEVRSRSADETKRAQKKPPVKPEEDGE